MLWKEEFWQTQEVIKLIREKFKVQLSDYQVRRILRDKWKMNFPKPYPRDYKRPDNAEELLGRQIELTYQYLTEAKGYSWEEIAIGFVDEGLPQLVANTVRVWSFGKPEIKKNTQKRRAHAMGFCSLRGKVVWEFTMDSKTERFLSFWKREEIRDKREE